MRNPTCYPKQGEDPKPFALRMSADHAPADGTIMQAIAQVLNCEIRIWKATNEALDGQPEVMQYHLYILKPNASVTSTPQRASPSVV